MLLISLVGTGLWKADGRPADCRPTKPTKGVTMRVVRVVGVGGLSLLLSACTVNIVMPTGAGMPAEEEGGVEKPRDFIAGRWEAAGGQMIQNYEFFEDGTLTVTVSGDKETVPGNYKFVDDKTIEASYRAPEGVKKRWAERVKQFKDFHRQIEEMKSKGTTAAPGVHAVVDAWGQMTLASLDRIPDDFPDRETLKVSIKKFDDVAQAGANGTGASPRGDTRPAEVDRGTGASTRRDNRAAGAAQGLQLTLRTERGMVHRFKKAK